MKRIGRPAVAVGIPMVQTLPRPAVVSFLDLVKRMRDDDVLIGMAQTAVTDEARNHIITTFLSLPKSIKYLFMFDDDMVVPIDTLERLTRHKRPFVAGLCHQKMPPYLPVAYKEGPVVGEVIPGMEHYGSIHYRYYHVNAPDEQGLWPVDATGAACLCLSRELLEAIEPPWFKFEGGGEDMYFCRKVKEAGFPILIDTSVRVGHVGQVVADFDLWLRYRPEVLERAGVHEHSQAGALASVAD